MTQATCRETGEWSVDEMTSTNDKSPVPTCRPIMCPKLQAPENGAVSADGPVAVGQVIILISTSIKYVQCNVGSINIQKKLLEIASL